MFFALKHFHKMKEEEVKCQQSYSQNTCVIPKKGRQMNNSYLIGWQSIVTRFSILFFFILAYFVASLRKSCISFSKNTQRNISLYLGNYLVLIICPFFNVSKKPNYIQAVLLPEKFIWSKNHFTTFNSLFEQGSCHKHFPIIRDFLETFIFRRKCISEKKSFLRKMHKLVWRQFIEYDICCVYHFRPWW